MSSESSNKKVLFSLWSCNVTECNRKPNIQRTYSTVYSNRIQGKKRRLGLKKEELKKRFEEG